MYNEKGVEITNPNDTAFLNPLRYRGYYYDDESGLYYLKSRYYNPEWGRFISADAFADTGQGALATNMYAYCLNNPVNLVDPSGLAGFCAHCHGYTTLLPCCKPAQPPTFMLNPTYVKYVCSYSTSDSLPTKGEPNSDQTLYNPDGTPKQKRWYGPNGDAIRDRDYSHQGQNIPFPHDHEWKNGKRGKEHLQPSPDYEFSLDTLVGIGVVTICTLGMGYVVINDITGVGVADNFLLAPFAAGFNSGITMIF